MAATLEFRLTEGPATTWAASTAYSVGDRVFPTSRNGYVYECITAGTSGSAEPTWPTKIGETVTDGTVTWKCWGTEGDNSLGGKMSPTVCPTNLFDDVKPAEAESGDDEYRAIDVLNTGDATAVSVQLYVDPETTHEKTWVDLGVDTANSPHTADASLPTIPDEGTAPSGITFGHYNASNKLSLPDIPAGQAVRVWIKRHVDPGATNLPNDTCTLKVEYA